MNDVTNPQAYPFTNIDDLTTLQKYNLDDNKMNENSSQEMRTWYYIKVSNNYLDDRSNIIFWSDTDTDIGIRNRCCKMWKYRAESVKRTCWNQLYQSNHTKLALRKCSKDSAQLDFNPITQTSDRRKIIQFNKKCRSLYMFQQIDIYKPKSCSS